MDSKFSYFVPYFLLVIFIQTAYSNSGYLPRDLLSYGPYNPLQHSLPSNPRPWDSEAVDSKHPQGYWRSYNYLANPDPVDFISQTHNYDSIRNIGFTSSFGGSSISHIVPYAAIGSTPRIMDGYPIQESWPSINEFLPVPVVHGHLSSIDSKELPHSFSSTAKPAQQLTHEDQCHMIDSSLSFMDSPIIQIIEPSALCDSAPIIELIRGLRPNSIIQVIKPGYHFDTIKSNEPFIEINNTINFCDTQNNIPIVPPPETFTKIIEKTAPLVDSESASLLENNKMMYPPGFQRQKAETEIEKETAFFKTASAKIRGYPSDQSEAPVIKIVDEPYDSMEIIKEPHESIEIFELPSVLNEENFIEIDSSVPPDSV